MCWTCSHPLLPSCSLFQFHYRFWTLCWHLPHKTDDTAFAEPGESRISQAASRFDRADTPCIHSWFSTPALLSATDSPGLSSITLLWPSSSWRVWSCPAIAILYHSFNIFLLKFLILFFHLISSCLYLSIVQLSGKLMCLNIAKFTPSGFILGVALLTWLLEVVLCQFEHVVHHLDFAIIIRLKQEM